MNPTSSASAGDPACSVCGGIGFYKKDVPVEHPDFGKAFPCTCAKPQIQQSRRREMNALGQLEALDDMTFESFRPDGIALSPERQRTLRAAYDAARAFAEYQHGWLYLTGGYGVGKTHLAAAIANAVTFRGDRAIFVLVPDLLDHLRNTYNPDSEESFDDLFERLKNTPLLILDDLGSEASTDWAREKLFQLLEHRYMRRLPTVITSNRPIDALDGRLRSRVHDIDLVHRLHILATDYRGGGYIDHTIELGELEFHNDKTFDTFRVPSSGREALRTNLLKIRNAAWDYAQDPQGWIVFMGTSTVGKTHLAAAIANHQRVIQPQVLFVSVSRLLDHLRASFKPYTPVPYDVRFEQVRQAPLLILDDLHGNISSPWAAEKLFQLIDFRYVTRKPTVFTVYASDDKMSELNQADPRIVARLRDDSICLLCHILGSGRARGRKY